VHKFIKGSDSTVVMCFLEAFDRMNHTKLFIKLHDTSYLIRILHYGIFSTSIHTSQVRQERIGTLYMTNGVRQGDMDYLSK